MKNSNVSYFRITEKHKQYKGECFFKFDIHSEDVLVVRFIKSTEQGKGRANSIGVYLIARLTFLSNYLTMNYVEPSSKKEFDKKFTTILKLLHTVG